MTDRSAKPRRRRRQARKDGLDHSLLPGVIVAHYGPGIGAVGAEVLLAAWSWYERGRQDGLEAGRQELDAERARLEAWCQRVVAAGTAPARPIAAPATTAGGALPAPRDTLPGPWKPKPQVFPEGHGQAYNPGDLPSEASDAVLDDFTAPAGEAPAGETVGQAVEVSEIDPRYSAIGHYSADVVAPIVRHAEALSKNPVFGVQVARQLLADGEQRCLDPPSGIVGQIEAKLRKHDMLRGENWKGMEEV